MRQNLNINPLTIIKKCWFVAETCICNVGTRLHELGWLSFAEISITEPAWLSCYNKVDFCCV